MAVRNKRFIFGLLTANLVELSSAVIKLHGIILLWKINQRKIINLALGIFSRQKSKISTKIEQRKLRRKQRGCWYKPGRTDLWWRNICLGVAPEECWKKFFRMDRNLFYKLLREVDPYITPNPLSPNYRALSSETKLALTLYYLKDTGSLSMASNSFGIAISTTSVVIYEVCKVICNVLGRKYICLPSDKCTMQKKVAEFEATFGMPQAFGCIDGTHVRIKRPIENSQDYFCYKQFFSLNVQAVCDYRGYFMDVECMWPGSVHDAKVFSNSDINKRLRNSELPNCLQTLVEGKPKVPTYIIGDPAYPVTPYCIKEFATCSSNEEVIFNNMLRAARNQIECAFGRLKARGSILTKTVDLKLESIPTVIYACFVLHNVCEDNKVTVDEELLQEQIHLIKQNEQQFKNAPDPVYSQNEGEGEIVRNTITALIQQS